jgi:hypothetical protein
MKNNERILRTIQASPPRWVLQWGNEIHIYHGGWIVTKKHLVTNRAIYCGYNYTITNVGMRAYYKEG